MEKKQSSFSLEEVQFLMNMMDKNPSSHPLYTTWKGMVSRCHKPNTTRFSDYGGRGISVCDEWRNSFASFLSWVETSDYSPELSLERMDNDLGYEPLNCKWATQKEQLRNTRKTRYITAFKETKSRAEWIEDPRCVIEYGTLKSRIERGWNPEEAISRKQSRGIHMNATQYEAFGDSKTLTDWSFDKRCAIPHRTLEARIQELGWDVEIALSTPVQGERNDPTK